MIKQCIINGDDLGLCQATTMGILSAYDEGILTSTTVMMNMPYAKKSLSLLKNYPDLGVGVHLNVTCGKPLTDGKSLVRDTIFHTESDYNNGYEVNLDELYQEWKAQIELFILLTNHKPTHLDSHHHIHLIKRHIPVIKRLIEEYELPVRGIDIPIIDTFYKDNANINYLKEVFTTHIGVIEIMCHPAFVDSTLKSLSSYTDERVKELSILLSDDIRDFIIDNDIELINYKRIKV